MDLRQRLWDGIALPAARWVGTRSRFQITTACLAVAFLIGLTDYYAGEDIKLTAAYLIPVSIAAWFTGFNFALLVAIASTGFWLGGDLLSEGFSGNVILMTLNGFIRVGFYIFLILVLVRLNYLQKHLEARVLERAAALAKEVGERQRLEREMLAISEREQRRIGQDLHDGLCQHLTGTALASHVLAERLASLEMQESESAGRIVDLVEEAINLARGMAKGLHPVEVQADGLMQALEEFASTTSNMFRIRCRFDCQIPVLIHTPATATHLYRIAQEAVSNAIKHGHAKDIVILLEENEFGIKLEISDDGKGLPNPLPRTSGMGLRIMSHRARMIGGDFSLGNKKSRGTDICCLIPRMV